MINRSFQFFILILAFFSVWLFVLACSSNSSSADRSSVKFTQYYVKGEELYLKNCSNCHQKNGTGLGLVYPPLNKSDYMDNNFSSVLCLMKYGSNQHLTVNGKTFAQSMPGIPTLTNLEIAEIATYIYNSWENERGLIDVSDVAPVMERCVTAN